MLYKSYIDRGRGLTSYFNELFLIFGTWTVFSYRSLWLIVIMFFSYVGLCLIVGWLYFKYGWQEAEAEVQNQYNLFQKQLRKQFKIKTFSEKFK